MDLSKLEYKELEILDAVFCSFDQGDFLNDLEHLDDPYDLYERMRDAFAKETAMRSLKKHAKPFEAIVEGQPGYRESTGGHIEAGDHIRT